VVSALKLIIRSIIHYRKEHFSVVVGTAISTMVLIGTLIVGDSVETSLESTTQLRLGDIGYTFSGIDRYFRAELADEISSSTGSEIAPIILLNGIGSSNGGEYRANKINVLGIDENFSSMIPGNIKINVPGKNEAFISENLSKRLNLQKGDAFLLKLEKASLLPKNAPFVSEADNQISVRLKVADILGLEKMGRFNLKTSQTAPFNVFLPLSYLNDKMETAGMANNLLIKGSSDLDQQTLTKAIQDNWKSEDLGIEIDLIKEPNQFEIRSKRVFIDSAIAETISEYEPESKRILTYFVNSIKKGNNLTPYSFMSAGPFSEPDDFIGKDEVIVNQWLADDLKINPGDSVEIEYFSIGPLRRLEETSRWFKIKKIVPVEGIYADRKLMPDLPGLTDAGNCSEWEAGIPINLEQIRDKDEDYWDEYKGTPKAFIGYHEGKNLWENRFGTCTAVRVPAEKHQKSEIKKYLSKNLDPWKFGFSLRPVKEKGLEAARGGTDFAQLFMGLSFFLLVAGLSLMALLYNLHLDKRMSQVGTMKALGFPDSLVRRIVLMEGLIVAVPGVVIGAILAIAYNKLIFAALNTVWNEIMRTSVLHEDIRMLTIISGILISLVLVIIIIWYNTWQKLRLKPVSLQRKSLKTSQRLMVHLANYGGWFSMAAAIALLVYDTVFGENLNANIFFAAGGLLLLSMLLISRMYFDRAIPGGTGMLSYGRLIQKNLLINNTRSLRIIILFALGTFVIVSTGLNRKDLHSGSEKRESGTGGFVFFGETTLPVLINLTSPAGKEQYGLEDEVSFVQMRKNEGDDASCLNLNKISQPRILGIPSQKLSGRFAFIKHTEDIDPNNPWISLKEKLPGGVVPAIADQTVIQWGLGMKVGDTLTYTNEAGHQLKLKLIGGLANSIFQGNILIDEVQFLEHFPSNSGSYVFLIDGQHEKKEDLINNLERSFRNEGLDLDLTSDRLAAFNEIENTYLSIFLILGGLAMILGTIGLGVSLARNIMDRRNELAILRAVGYKKSTIMNTITVEHLILLGIGTLIGAITAFVATIPAILSDFVDANWQIAAWIVLLILLNGWIWILLITKNNLKKHLLSSLRTE